MSAAHHAQRAQVLIEQNRHREALKELSLALAEEPNNAFVLYLMSYCHLQDDNITEAEAMIKAAISLEPDEDVFLGQLARVQIHKEDYTDAEKTIRSAIAFEPFKADHWGVLSFIKINQKKYEEGLEAANKGLEVESDNLFCLNQRSTALIKLNRKEEAFETLQGTLEEDPENSYTHANYGWAELEKGNHKKALEHFREALKLDSMNAYAKSGMVEALKSKYWFYRVFLKYSFWASNLSAQAQWGLIIGLYILRQFSGRLANGDSAIAYAAEVFNILYLVFVLSTWLIEPLSNLLLRLNVYGRYALSEEAKKSSTFVGLSLLTGLSGFLLYLVYPHEFLLVIGFVAVGCALPLSSMYKPRKEKAKRTMKYYAVSMIAVGLLAVVFTILTGNSGNAFSILFGIGFFVHGWVLNAMVIK
ncbi:MAG: tetratricopeptide repeat protein [Bacteroidia bacterium]